MVYFFCKWHFEEPVGNGVSRRRADRSVVGRRRSPVAGLALLLWACWSGYRADPVSAAEAVLPSAPTSADVEFFEKKIRPLLVQRCQTCHGAEKQKGGLRLDAHLALLKGGDSGPVVTAGKPEESLLIEAVQYTGDYKMPPSGKLPDEEIAALSEWVRRGTPWPAGEVVTPPSVTKSAAPVFDLQGRKSRQWALQPVRALPPPSVARSDWGQSPIDQFILSKLEQAKLSPAPPTDRRTWLRRVTLDLTGLPPTVAEIDTFLSDKSPDAFDRVVDRLLASPHYGERWARHWLDLVRYAETYGHEFDFEIPQASEYRDYVIRAFNADVPYDQFVIEHLAGDLLLQPRRHPQERFNESIIGTGFFFLGEAKHSPVDLRVDEDERIDNQVDVFGKTFLGMTLGCARCHDHKFDAISAKDYYALTGYLQSSRYQVVCVDAPEPQAKIVSELEYLQRERDRLDDISQLTALRAAKNKREVRASIAKSLMTAAQVLRAKSTSSDPSHQKQSLEKLARQASLSPGNLERWVMYLEQTAYKSPDDLFYPWAQWALQVGPPANDFGRFHEELRTKLTARQRRVSETRKKVIDFEDFSRADYANWFVTGDAFGVGPQRGIASSGSLTPKLQGALRSQTFTLEKPWIHYRASGRQARIRLIVDGLQLIQNPLYGQFQISLNQGGALQWHPQFVGKFVGHKAYIEFLDAGDGELAVDEIVFSDHAAPPDRLEPGVVALLERSDLKTAQSWADEYARVLHVAADPAASDAAPRTAKGFFPDPVPPDHLRDLAARWLNDQRRHGWQPLKPEKTAGEIAAKRADFDQRFVALEKQIQYRRFALTLGDGTAEDDAVHLRGNYKFSGDVVPRRFLEALGGTRFPAATLGSGRLALARQVVAAENPLTARVMVNRVWKHHFGEGLVRTPDDFGNMGRPPTHPELLDFLATEFVREGWSLKKLHRRILLSSTYRMSSRPDDLRAEEADPQNLLLHRMPIRRLEAEAIRDSLLAVSGRLNRQMYGPSVAPHLTSFMEGRGRPGHSGPLDGDGRRTLYLGIRRNFLNPLLLAFDTPVPFATMGRRSATNVPAQALALLNNPLVLQQAELWGRKVAAEQTPPASRVKEMYLTAFGRPPTESELVDALNFVTVPLNKSAEEAHRPWVDFAHVLFNVKEFVFVN